MRRAVACRVVSHVRGPLVAPHVRSLSTFTAPPPTPARPGPGWRNAGWAAAALGAAAAAVGQSVVYADGLVKPLPVYTRAQVAEHATKAAGIWVTYKDSVYDITGASPAYEANLYSGDCALSSRLLNALRERQP
jgi:hypothetical protein